VVRRLSFIVVALAATLIFQAAVSALVAQQEGSAGGGGQVGQAQRPAGPEAGAAMQQQLDQALRQAGLTDAERAAAERAVNAKLDARRDLAAALGQLRRTALGQNATDDQLKSASDTYRQALAKYRSRVEAEDQGLIKQLSARSQVRCLALGVLDNGLGIGVGMPRQGGGGAGGGRGGGRGRPRGRGAIGGILR